MTHPQTRLLAGAILIAGGVIAFGIADVANATSFRNKSAYPFAGTVMILGVLLGVSGLRQSRS